MSIFGRIAVTIQPKIPPPLVGKSTNRHPYQLLLYAWGQLPAPQAIRLFRSSFNTSTLNADGTETTGPTEPPTTRWLT